MANIYYDSDANPDLIKGKNVAIIGYGSQGHAHALNLQDSGVTIKVGLRPGSKSTQKAEKDGLTVVSVDEAAEWADIIMILAPDTAQPQIYQDHIQSHLKPGKTLMFAHGFNIRYNTITPPPDIDVSMIAPKAPGHRVREIYVEGGGTPSLLAVEQDASGQAKEMALSYAHALGATRAGVVETTFKEETETDLFGEQAVLCGGVSELVKAGFEVLVKAGYQPELAYFECMHELKLIVDLMYRGGLNYMRYSISDTAEHGDYTAGERIINEDTKGVMRQILSDIQDGTYAEKWIDENKKGRPWFNKKRQEEQNILLEEVGSKLRKMMPFVNPIEIKAGDD